MTWEVPNSISPSRMGLFMQCPLKFRFETIQKLRTRPGPAAVAGTTIHAALELFMQLPPEERTHKILDDIIEECLEAIREDEDYQHLTPEQLKGFDALVRRVAPRVFDVMDVSHTPVHREGQFETELRFEVDLDGWILRGIIDVLKWHDGVPSIGDYKSGRAPSERYLDKAMLGIKFYSVMVTRHYGVIPSRAALLYLATRQVFSFTPNEANIKVMERKILAVRSGIVAACEKDAFKTSTSKLCDYCDFKPYCPAHGGDQDLALEDPRFVREVPVE